MVSTSVAVRRASELAVCQLRRRRSERASASVTARSAAVRLGASEKTVKAHVSAILAKLGVADRTQAALHAVRTGLADA